MLETNDKPEMTPNTREDEIFISKEEIDEPNKNVMSKSIHIIGIKLYVSSTVC